ARFPYIPGLFSFRELPPLLAAFARLERRPDVLLFDGQGLAHPRGLGLACHAGVLFGVPSVGCAKSRLVGTHDPVGGDRGAWTPLAFEGRTVGAALRTRTGVKPVYVSPGHLVDLASSIRLVLDTTERFRLPEPIRLAHAATGDLMRRLDPRAPVPRTRGYPDFRAKTTWPRAAERDPGARRRGR
ncbi:MAG TPA: endonuclease V, partial [Vicinamibacteria bacterium]